jgi:hypothetical protein
MALLIGELLRRTAATQQVQRKQLVERILAQPAAV